PVIFLEQEPHWTERRIVGRQLDDRRYRGVFPPPGLVLRERRDRVAEGLQLVRVDQLVIVQVEAVERRDRRGELVLGERAVLVPVEGVEQRIVAIDRQAADLHPEGAERRPQDLGQLFQGDLAVLRVGVQVGARQRRRASGGGPDHQRQRAAVGLLP